MAYSTEVMSLVEIGLPSPLSYNSMRYPTMGWEDMSLISSMKKGWISSKIGYISKENDLLL